eukprot:3113469-Pyramimonas_sp.AAC.1
MHSVLPLAHGRANFWTDFVFSRSWGRRPLHIFHPALSTAYGRAMWPVFCVPTSSCSPAMAVGSSARAAR